MAQPVDGTEVRFSTKDRGGSAKTMTAITLVEDPVVTCEGHGLSNGDAIEISGSSLKDLNRMHTIALVDENSFVLPGFDLSKIKTAIATPGTFKTVVMTQFCDATGFDIDEFSVSSENKNTVCRKTKTFTVELGSVSVDFESDSDDPLQNDLRKSGKKLKPVLMQLRRADAYQLRGYLMQITSFPENGDAEGTWEGSFDAELLSFSQDVDMTPAIP